MLAAYRESVSSNPGRFSVIREEEPDYHGDEDHVPSGRF